MELEKHSWKTLRNRIKSIYPKLANIIDPLSPPDDHTLYIARYPYGAMILDQGLFNIPNTDGLIVPLKHSSISTRIKEDLNYNGTMAVGLISKNSIESFVATRDRIIPATLFTEGKMITLWRVLDDEKSYQDGNFWNVSSGARTIYMLPKITDKQCYRRLKVKHKLNLPIPNKLKDHWNIFSHLANQESFSASWYSEIIFFSKKWFSHKKDSKWQPFNYFLLNETWQWSAFKRNQFIFDFIFSAIQENKNMRPNPYLADTAKYLISISSGSTPALIPAIDESAAPIRGLQEIFLEDYGLKKYAPIIMHTHHFSPHKNQSVYYSFQMPTTMIFSPRSNNALSTMAELHELKHILEITYSQIIKNNFGIEKTPLYTFIKNTELNYYHSDKDKLREILSVSKISAFDNAFSRSLIDDKSYSFPEFSPFFRGCISISKKSS